MSLKEYELTIGNAAKAFDGAWDMYMSARKEAELFCDKCGESCMHDNSNRVGIEVDVSGMPESLREKFDKSKFILCYPCWINGMIKND
jgi:hypothetical protein